MRFIKNSFWGKEGIDSGINDKEGCLESKKINHPAGVKEIIIHNKFRFYRGNWWVRNLLMINHPAGVKDTG